MGTFMWQTNQTQNFGFNFNFMDGQTAQEGIYQMPSPITSDQQLVRIFLEVGSQIINRLIEQSGEPLLLLQHFKFEIQLLSSNHTAQIELPELSRESESGPALVQIDDELQTHGAPKVCQ